MKWLIVICLLILAGCQLENGQPMNLDPVIEAVAPVAFQLLLPEISIPWKMLALLGLAVFGGSRIRRTKK